MPHFHDSSAAAEGAEGCTQAGPGGFAAAAAAAAAAAVCLSIAIASTDCAGTQKVADPGLHNYMWIGKSLMN